jgi:dipeptidyl aminopeptidase/acylaminoacyl peptidase
LWTFTDMKDAVWPIGFDRDPQELYVQALHEGRQAVYSVRLDDAALPRKLRLAHPTLDVEGRLFVAPDSGEVLGVHSNLDNQGDGSDDGEGAELWAPAWRALVRVIDAALPGRDNRITQISHDGRRYLVYSSGNAQPGRYYFGDRETGALALIGETYPELVRGPLAGKQAQAIKARDGLAMRVYLTLPGGRRVGDKAAPLPLVLLPHGGPQSRDDADFDDWTEFLADRGYAVLQVNFRGSDGYGHAFKEAGLKRWGLEMQDDLTDAVQWAIAQGVADPARICIAGASYGGYAALMGAVKTPELYRCAVSFAGVADLPDLVMHMTDYIGGQAAAERLIGEVWGDRSRLRATSPALHAERIRAPVLLLHGTADRSVPVQQSQGMARALKSAGKAHRYIEQEGGDHHLSRQGHRTEFFRELETFLDQHIGAPAR